MEIYVKVRVFSDIARSASFHDILVALFSDRIHFRFGVGNCCIEELPVLVDAFALRMLTESCVRKTSLNYMLSGTKLLTCHL